MAEDALHTLSLRNDFYRDNYRRVMLVLLLSILINIALASTLFYLINNPPVPKYFATSMNGRITKIEPLSEPYQSDSAVLQWAQMGKKARSHR